MITQFLQAGRLSSHLMCRRLHVLQPYRDFVWDLRVLIGIYATSWVLVGWREATFGLGHSWYNLRTDTVPHARIPRIKGPVIGSTCAHPIASLCVRMSIVGRCSPLPTLRWRRVMLPWGIPLGYIGVAMNDGSNSYDESAYPNANAERKPKCPELVVA